MRRATWELCLLIIAIIGIHAERSMHNGTVEGSVYPSNLSPSVVAVNGSDSVKTFSNDDGHFGMQLQPGMWKVIFAVKSPSQSLVEKNIMVSEGQRIDLGEIKFAE
ncbi:MAG TPA: hypothetical protein VG890_08440 [Puia sp.]|jgi:hypothetical protein|nr:hypothetical protein [Puia sp.]